MENSKDLREEIKEIIKNFDVGFFLECHALEDIGEENLNLLTDQIIAKFGETAEAVARVREWCKTKLKNSKSNEDIQYCLEILSLILPQKDFVLDDYLCHTLKWEQFGYNGYKKGNAKVYLYDNKKIELFDGVNKIYDGAVGSLFFWNALLKNTKVEI
jgi:hypothetical protein